MKWIVFGLAVIIVGCSPSRRIQWHENRLDALEQQYPSLFSKQALDSIINARALSLATKMILELDSNKLKDLNKQVDNYRANEDSAIKNVQDKGIKDCDTIIKYVQLERKPQNQIKDVHKQSKCVVLPKTLDTLGVHIQVMGVNGEIDISVKVDSIHVHKDCPPCFTPKQREYWEFWQFWTWVILTPLFCCTLLTFVIKLILRRK